MDNFIEELHVKEVDGVNNTVTLLEALCAFVKIKNILLYQIVPTHNCFEQREKVPINSDFFIGFKKEHIEDSEFTMVNRNYLYISYLKEVYNHKKR